MLYVLICIVSTLNNIKNISEVLLYTYIFLTNFEHVHTAGKI